MDREKKVPVSKIDDINVTWQAIIDESQDKLVVIDCHQEWCGPCDAISPTLQRLFLDYDHCEERLILATLSYTSDQSAAGGPPCGVSSLGEKVQAMIPAAAKLSLATQGCLPLFLCLRFKQCVAYTVGVDAPTLMQQVMLNIPDFKAKEED